jgi:hypothetical protein
MPQPRNTSPLRKAFNVGERMVGRPLEAVGQSPLVNTAAILAVRGQARARRTAEELASLTVNAWGFASRRDIRTVLRRLADIERALLEVEHQVDRTARAGAPAAPRSAGSPNAGRSPEPPGPDANSNRDKREDARTITD